MTIAPSERALPRPKTEIPRARLSCDRDGSWILAAADAPVRRFSDFDAAVEGASHIPALKAATIEVWAEGEYVCCLPAKSWAQSPGTVPPAPEPAVGPSFPRAGRAANRAARVMLAIVGPLFWLALVGVALAASLGWRVALLH